MPSPTPRALLRRLVRSLLVVVTFCLLLGLAPLPSWAVNYTIHAGSPESIDLSNVGLTPGDHVYLQAHTRKRLIIQNLSAGTPERPIIITNQGGPFIIDTTDTDKGLHFYNCRYFILRGTQPPDSTDYGIKLLRVSQSGAIALAFIQRTTDFEVSHLEIGNVGFAGVMAKTDGVDRSEFTMRNVSIHHLHIHDTGGEAIYVGDSSYHDTVKNPHAIHNVAIHDNLIVNAGWDGIQLGAATQGAAVYRNRILGYGTAEIDAPNHYVQNEGIRINPGTAGVVHDNWIVGGNPGSGTGIFGNPHDDSVYFNNVIINPGETGIVIGADFAQNPGTTVLLLNNTIINPAHHGFEFWSEGAEGSVIGNNIVVGHGTDPEHTFVHRETPTVEVTEQTNLFTLDAADIAFADAPGGNYRLASTSPAIDAGTNYFTAGVTADHEGVTRPFGAAYDLGAFEYYASPDGTPLIVAQPKSQTVLVGRDVELKTIAAGDAPLAYQWKKDGTDIAGATNPRLLLSSPGVTASGDYTVTVTNALGTATSDVAVITVNEPPPLPPTITTQPASQTVMEGADVTFSVSAYGDAPITYQWKKGTDDIPGATAATLTLTDVPVSASGDYTVVLTNPASSVTSNVATLTVNPAPTFPTTYSVTTIVNDATVQPHVNATSTYTHAINIGASTTVTVNGLAFGFGTGNGGGAQPAKGYTFSTFNNTSSSFAPTATGDIRTLLTTRSTHTTSGSYTLTLSGLTTGRRYTFALFNDSAHGAGRNWYRVSQNADSTTFDLDFSASGVNSSRQTTATYTAPGTSVTFTFTRLDGQGTTGSGSWVGFAGFVNYEAPEPPAITTQPAGQTANAGGNVTLAVTATGAAPLAYQWAKDGVDLPGATAATLPLFNVQPADAGSYTVRVSNVSGTLTSDPAILTVHATLYSVATIASDATVAPHLSPSLTYTHRIDINATSSVTVLGVPFAFGTGNGGGAQPALGYTFSAFNNVSSTFNSTATGEIRSVLATRATHTSSATYTLTLDGLTAGQSYTLALFNDSNHGVGRNWYRVAPSIEASAFELDFSAGGVNSSRVLAVTYVPTSSSATFTFTRLDGWGTPGQTNMSSWVGFAGFVNYALPATPTVVLGPKSQTVDAGTPTALGVSARGQEPLTYQWFKDASPVAGATADTLVFPNPLPADSGSYTVTVTNTLGSATSAAAMLTVNALVAPAITTQPTSRSAEAGTSTTFTVAATGTAPLTYQWFKGPDAISGATTATLALNNLTAAMAGDYTVAVTNSVSSVTSNIATLTVTEPAPVAPAITTQPASVTVDVNLNTSFAVVASGTAPLSYQWFKGTDAIPGATSATLALPAVPTTAAGDYSVVVTNAVDSVTSAVATLTVNVPRQTAQRATLAGQFDLNYLLYLPTGYEGGSAEWPLLVFLHGLGERSTNEANPMDPIHLNKLKILGPPKRIQQGAEFPMIIVSPQCAIDWWQGAQLEQFISELELRYRVDRTRIYLTGLSMGGFGVYDLAQRNPTRYAAIAPISAAPQIDAGNSAAAPGLRALPLWAFHGASDPLYSVADLQAYLDLIRAAGGSPRVTIYSTPPGNLHDAWVPAYADDAVFTWLLSHTAQPPAVTTALSSVSALVGQAVTFTVAASGREPLTYQWAKDNTPLPGAATATLQLPAVQLADAGSYSVTLRNGVGTTTSPPATLAVFADLFSAWTDDNNIPADQRGFTDDPDTDGRNNLVEFALATSAVTPDAAALTVATEVIEGVEYPTFTFARRSELGIVEVVVVVTDDPGSITDLGSVELSTTPQGDGTELVVVRSAQPLAAQPRQFFHLRITHP